jgi:Lysine methyltransferase
LPDTSGRLLGTRFDAADIGDRDGALGCLELYKCLLRAGEEVVMMPLLHGLLMEQMNIDVVELGSGCGIAGIGLAQIIPGSKVLLSDLEEAQGIIAKNIKHASLAFKSSLKQEVLDWNQPLSATEDHKKVDLLILCECIYNADSDPALISILQQFINYSPQVKILVITKRRHFSETEFFDLMEKAGIPILEQCLLPLPHHFSEADFELPKVEIYLYGAIQPEKDWE